MATQRQLEANRRNAQRSTGPTSDLGKSVARFNALKTGLTASTAVLPHEDPNSYTSLRDSFVAAYRPDNAVEASLVEVIVNSYWRLLRAGRAEAAAMNLEIRGLKSRNNKSLAPREDDDNALAVVLVTSDAIEKIERHQAKAQRAYLQAIETLRKLQKERLREERVTTAPIAKIGFVSAPLPEPYVGDQDLAQDEDKTTIHMIERRSREDCAAHAHTPIQRPASRF